ncbi:MAG: hypothetical protein ABWY63_00980 [Hyphomicrobiaceae bacterium]
MAEPKAEPKTEKEEKPAQNQGTPPVGEAGTSAKKQGIPGDAPEGPPQPGRHSQGS